MGQFAQYLSTIRVKKIIISAYNPRANSVAKHSHFTIVSAIRKMLNGNVTGQVRILPYALFANRTSLRRSHGKSPFYLLHGFKPIIPIETTIPTWHVQAWAPDISAQDALNSRLQALLNLPQDVNAAIKSVSEYRQKATQQDIHHGFPQPIPLQKDDLVLLINEQRKVDHSSFRKLTYHQFGPFVIHNIYPNNVYKLRTPNGIHLTGTFPPKRLKRFINHSRIQEPEPHLLQETNPVSTTDDNDPFPDISVKFGPSSPNLDNLNSNRYQDQSNTSSSATQAYLASSSSESSNSSDSDIQDNQPITRLHTKQRNSTNKPSQFINIPLLQSDNPQRSQYNQLSNTSESQLRCLFSRGGGFFSRTTTHTFIIL